MARLQPYEITNENGFTTTLLLSEHDAKARGLLADAPAAKPKGAAKRAPRPRNKQAPAPEDKAAPPATEDTPDEPADFSAFETTSD